MSSVIEMKLKGYLGLKGNQGIVGPMNLCSHNMINESSRRRWIIHMQSLWLTWNQRYWVLERNQVIVMQMNLCQVSMIEMKSKYCELKLNRLIVIDI